MSSLTQQKSASCNAAIAGFCACGDDGSPETAEVKRQMHSLGSPILIGDAGSAALDPELSK
jgi:hypothetical protein